MKKIAVILTCLCFLLAWGCYDKEGTAHQTDAKRVNDEVEEALGVTVIRQRTKLNRVDSDMCEGEQVAASMMLHESGRSPNLDDYISVQIADVEDDEGNKYKILYLDRREVVIPERYK